MSDRLALTNLNSLAWFLLTSGLVEHFVAEGFRAFRWSPWPAASFAISCGGHFEPNPSFLPQIQSPTLCALRRQRSAIYSKKSRSSGCWVAINYISSLHHTASRSHAERFTAYRAIGDIVIVCRSRFKLYMSSSRVGAARIRGARTLRNVLRTTSLAHAHCITGRSDKQDPELAERFKCRLWAPRISAVRPCR